MTKTCLIERFYQGHGKQESKWQKRRQFQKLRFEREMFDSTEFLHFFNGLFKIMFRIWCIPNLTGVLDSPKTCLHSILTLLEQGLGTRDGPSCLHAQPKLAELGFHLIYALCANKDTSPATLRYLRTTHDFLYQQLQHLPLESKKYGVYDAYLVITEEVSFMTTVCSV